MSRSTSEAAVKGYRDECLLQTMYWPLRDNDGHTGIGH